MDPLSDVLSLLKPLNHMSAGFEAGGDWSVRFPDQEEKIKCGAVVSGRCWLAVEGIADPVLLEGGDSFLLASGRPFRLASDLSLPPVEARTVFSTARMGGMVKYNGGSDVVLVSSQFRLSGEQAEILLRMLPPIVHIRGGREQAALRWSVERIMQELREPQPGGFLVVQHLAHMILIQALRLHLASRSGAAVGWLFALADRRMGSAIAALHADPARRWTLQELAAHVGMSRSSFAQKFRETVGASPMDYLTRWRMLLAGDRLTNSGEPVSAIALSLGYESESAFSTAFKKTMGCSPRQYVRGAVAVSAT